MRLQLIGNFSLDEFQEAVSVVIEDLKSSEIDSLRNVNIYAGLCVNGSETHFMDGSSEVKHLVYDLGRRQHLSLSTARVVEEPIEIVPTPSDEQE